MKREQELLDRYLNGQASEAEVAELDRLLQENEELRREFQQHANVIAALEEHGSYDDPYADTAFAASTRAKKSFGPMHWLALSALFVLLGGFVLASLRAPTAVATLVSNENAAWESALPTTPGSALPPGVMSLKSGLATIRFQSGAELTLEAPAEIELETAMRGRLFSGRAIVEVPESAHGFVLDTPDGYAVDHGTSFAVSVGPGGEESSFEVLDGEIALHSSGEEPVHLFENQAALMNNGRIKKLNGPLDEGTLDSPREVVRITSLGKTTSIVRNDQFQYLHPDFLMVKLDGGNRPYERRAFVSFQLDSIDWEKLEKIRLRLNLVPCGLGHVTRLAKMNRFQVSGLPGELPIDWQSNLSWEDAPNPKAAKPLGHFDVPRSQERGSFEIETDLLEKFLREQGTGAVTLLITRETEELKGSGLVHAFASDSHPEASGPTLEVTYR